MYNINILSEVNDEYIRVAIISAVTEFMAGESNLNIVKMRRGSSSPSVWNSAARENIDF